MKRILVFQHVPYEILGTFHPLLKNAGFRIRYANFGRQPEPQVDMSKYDGLVVLGGPMGVCDADKHPHLTQEIRAIRDAIQHDKPVLGICLGSQLIAAALGAKVYKNEKKEIGWYDVSLTDEGKKDPVLSGIGGTKKIFQWHGDTFDIPYGGTWLAKSEACANQAFRYGDKVYGLQFHLEVDEPMVSRWLQIPENIAEMKAMGGDTIADGIRKQTPALIDPLKQMSDKVFGRYIELFSTKRRTIVLGSKT